MKWLKKKLRNWILNEESMSGINKEVNLVSREDDILGDVDNPFRFSIAKANGGYIVSTRRYNHRTDQKDGNVYVLSEDASLAEEIGNIVSIEALKL